MAKTSPKAARERAGRYETSWQANSPDKNWADMSLADFKGKRKEVADVEDEIEAVKAQLESLLIKRDNLNEELMQSCDYISSQVEGSRAYGPDSALFAGFGYIRKSEKKSRKPKKSAAEK